ncbi:MAG: response regulator transcription factor [bacterium]|nr:response regulator transcription factor [bacterium]
MAENRALPERHRILIVDDHPIVREGLDALISMHKDLEVCGHASSIQEALDLVETTNPRVAIVDLSLTDGSGISLISELKSRNSPVRTLVSSMHDETMYAERSLQAGALGYVNKQEASSRIIEAIHCVLDGKVYLSERMAERVLRRMVGTGAKVESGSVDALSNRELEVFELLGNGFSSNEIAEKMHLSVKTIQTYRQRIKQKLLARNSTELIRLASTWVVQGG